MRVFLDANVIFSAAKSNGAVRELLVRLRAAGHILCVDDYALSEAQRNLSLKGADSMAALADLQVHFSVAPFRPTRLPADLQGLLPEKDRPILAAAIRLKCDALVTGG